MSEEKPPRIEKVERFSQQQRELLIWLASQEDIGEPLIDKPRAYRPSPIPWSSREFLGEEPTTNQSSALSRTLSGLEDRGLVRLQRGEGKRPRTSHVSLTRKGRIFAEALARGYVIGKPKREKGKPYDVGQENMLRLSVLLFKRELKRVEAALNTGERNFARFDIPHTRGGTAKTLEEVKEYQFTLELALKKAEGQVDEGQREFKKLLQRLVNEGLLTASPEAAAHLDAGGS